MSRPKSPTGNRRRIRISLTCHTGIEPIRQFLDFFFSARREDRPEYLRMCLCVGFRAGRPDLCDWPRRPDPSGKTLKITLDFCGDHPCLGSFLKKYDSESWDRQTRWVLETIVLGHEILSGIVSGKYEREMRATEGKRAIVSPSSASKDILGELFT